ncbi:ribosome maturation factor RimM [Lachnospiraceae bacterium ZAX-1]
MDENIQVGIITSTHGIKGEVKVFPTTDDATRFQQLKQVILDTGKEQQTLEITQVKFFKNKVILKFKGIDDINEVERYKGKSLYVTKEQALPCGEDEYFIGDLIGMAVVSDEGEALGDIVDVLLTGANDVYVVAGQDKKELLLPAIKECILNVDMKGRIMRVHLMRGLR